MMVSNGKPWPQTVLSFLKDSIEKNEAPALKSGNHCVSFDELVERARLMRDGLKVGFNIRRGSRVMIIFSDDAPAWLSFGVLQFAIGCLGACFSVMDTRSKAMSTEARAHMVKLFGPDLFITIGNVTIPEFPADGYRCASIDEIAGNACCAGEELLCEAELSDAAFVDWTSGSTGGLPKGCICTHETLSNMYVQKWCESSGFLSPEQLPVVGFNLFFLWYWWQPLCHGGTSVLLLDSEIRDLNLLTESIQRNRINAIDCITPSLLKVIVAHYPRDASHFPSTILVSGEALPLDLCEDFLARFPDTNLVNIFSTTETGDAGIACVTQDLLERSQREGLTSCPIEKALHGVSLILRPISGEEDPEVGELIVSGVGAEEYIGDLEASAKGFSKELGWLSRDRARRVDNMIAILGRLDDCVKVRGFKIDMKAIEDACRIFDKDMVRDAVAVVDKDQRICLFVRTVGEIDKDKLVGWLREKLAQSHWPQLIHTQTSEFPLTRTGKLDKKLLLSFLKNSSIGNTGGRFSESVDRVLKAFSEVGLEHGNSPKASFWELGGTSLMAISLCHILGIPASVFLDMSNPSAENLSDLLLSSKTSHDQKGNSVHTRGSDSANVKGVCIVGMSGRWPRVDKPGEPMTSSDLIQLLKDEFLPLSPPPVGGGKGNVPQGFYLGKEAIEGFDHQFWRMSQSSAASIDPHQRIFCEMSYEALLDAGNPSDLSRCGVFASNGSLSHFLELLTDGESLSSIRERDPAKYLELELGCDKDYIALRAAKFLNARGPAVTVQAACASSLVAIVQAVHAIRTNQCEMAIAGGVSLVVPETAHASAPGLIWSTDGGCKPFDGSTTGTANCNGGHCFVLKRTDLALQDGDPIYCEIIGTGLNNDGSRGKDFVAPSVSGHQQAMRDALADAGVDAKNISLVEAHGTGTLLGDPMEYAALSTVYRPASGDIGNQSVLHVGSVKGNVGHANTAAGALGLAKAAVCVFNKVFVKSGSFENLNPHIQANPLVKIQDAVEDWPEHPSGRRMAGVSSLGMGGTNCHVIIASMDNKLREEERYKSRSPSKLPILLSSHSESSLKLLAERMHSVLLNKTHEEWNQIAFTFAHGRPEQVWRKSINTVSELEGKLGTWDIAGPTAVRTRNLVLLFPGQGVDALPKNFDFDPELIDLLDKENPLSRVSDPVWFQITLFGISYTAGKKVLHTISTLQAVEVWCIGHSLGEYVAAVLGGMMTLKDAIALVKLRSELLVVHTKDGAMAAVSAPLIDVETAMSGTNLDIACINREDRIIISGAQNEVDIFIANSGLACKKISTIGAFHSRLTDPVKAAIDQYIVAQGMAQRFEKSKPNVHVFSTCTGALLESINEEHWGIHTRNPVKMTQTLTALRERFSNSDSVGFLNVGPGITMSQLVRSTSGFRTNCVSLFAGETMRDPSQCLWELEILDASVLVPKNLGLQRVLGLPTVCWDRPVCWPQQHRASKRNTAIQRDGESKDLFYKEEWVPVYVETSDRVETVHANDPEINSVLTHWLFEEGVHVCVHFASSEETHPKNANSKDIADCQSLQARLCVQILQTVIKGRQSIDPFIAVHLTLSVPNTVEFGAVVGIVRCAMSEHPDLNISVMFRTGTANVFPRMCGEYKLREGLLLSRRIRKTHVADNISSGFPVGGKYIVTGGLGGIGRLLVNWLLDSKEAATVLLLVRKMPIDDPFPGKNNRVTFLEANLDDKRDVSKVLEPFAKSTDMVFHLAGTVHDSLIANIDESMCVSLISSGKLKGLVSLMHALPSKIPIYVFSTSSAMLGSPGQGLYAAANAGIDALASLTGDRKIFSIQWGGWDASIAHSMSERFGLAPIDGCERYLTSSQGIDCLEKIVLSKREGGVIGVMDIYDWVKYGKETQVYASQLGSLLPNPGTDWIVSEEQIVARPDLAWVLDHREETGGVLIPATGLLGTLTNGSVSLLNVRFKEPLRLGQKIFVRELGSHRCIVSDNERVHASAYLGQQEPNFSLSSRRIKNWLLEIDLEGMENHSVSMLYDSLTEGGFNYGPSFRLVDQIFVSSEKSFAFACIQDFFAEGSLFELPNSVYWKHARVLDACTHIASVLDNRASNAFPSHIARFDFSNGDTDKSLFDHLSNRLLGGPKESVFVGMKLVSSSMSETVVVDLVVIGKNFTASFDGLELTPGIGGQIDDSDWIVLQRTDSSEDFAPVALLEENGDSRNVVVPRSAFKVLPTGNFLTLPDPAKSLEPNSLRIQVCVYGLSFLDVLASTGVMPESMFGGEFSGTIIAVGSEIEQKFRIGDRVAAVCNGGFQSVMDIDANFVSHIPSAMSFEDAATVPVSLCTALLALEKANMSPDRPLTVLIHNISGALGMALLSIVRIKYPKAFVVGSCSGGKREFVTNTLKVDRVIDSRDVSKWSLALLNSVDVSIGAMHPELLHATIPLLKSFGVLVDVGKRCQVESNFSLPLGAFVKGLTYTTGAHLDELMRIDPEHVHRLLESAFQLGVSLPFKQFAVTEIKQALKFLSSGIHTGKIIIRFALPERDLPAGVQLEQASSIVDNSEGKLSEAVLHALEKIVVGNAHVYCLDSISVSPQVLGSVWIDPSVPVNIIDRIPRGFGDLIVCRESSLVGANPVFKPLRKARASLIEKISSESSKADQSEHEWLVHAVVKLVGSESISFDSSFEQLGIDSLGRLQLWHSFKRQFPLSKLAAFPFTGTTSLDALKENNSGLTPKSFGKLKWLGIHGFRTNEVVIQIQLAELVERMGSSVELLTVRAPFRAKGPCPEGIEEGFEWWSSTETNSSYQQGWVGDQGLDESILYVEAYVKENGPFDLVVGFSQGAAVAHYLAAKGLVGKCLLFSPVAPKNRPWDPQTTGKEIFKSLVVFDDKDETVRGYPFGTRNIVLHNEGHVIPKISETMFQSIRNFSKL
jgi:3-oxoacyl-(acyl-carrier-protein) synthase/NADPH:quinone reductase-like Zn-dependent oxidoreductase/acyl-CoA synthetase (AMP-forming)/AMP-acid ligase II